MACRRCQPIVDAKDAEIERLNKRVDTLERYLMAAQDARGGGNILAQMAEATAAEQEVGPDTVAGHASDGSPVTFGEVATRFRRWHGGAATGVPRVIGEDT